MSHDTACQPEGEESRFEPESVQRMLEQWGRSLPIPRSRRRGRPLRLSWPHLCCGIMYCMLQGWHHQRDLWRLLCCQALGPFDPVALCDQAIYNRLEGAGVWMERFFAEVSQWLREELSPWQDRTLAPFAHSVLALDESVLDQVARWLPGLRTLGQRDTRLLAGRLCGLFDVRRQQWVRVDLLSEAAANCKVHAQEMLTGLCAGTLVLFDRGYLSFPFFDELSTQGIWWVSRYANNVSYKVRHICYEGDGVLDAIVWLGVYRADQARFPVRLVTFYVKRKRYRYLSNVLDPHLLPLSEIARLYARRWDIEMAFRLLKDYLGNNDLWSAKWSVVQVQIWAGLLLGQLFHASQIKVAAEAGVEPFEVSMPLLVRLVPALCLTGGAPVARIVRWGRDLGVIRPSQRFHTQVPHIDPRWVSPPPKEALAPRPHVRYAGKSESHPYRKKGAS